MSPLLGALGIALLFLVSCAAPPQWWRPAMPYPQPAPPVYQPNPQQPSPHQPTRPQPQPNPTRPVTYVPPQQTAPVNVGVQFRSLSPKLVNAAGNTLRNSDRPAALPAVNGMVKAAYPSALAYRDVQVQFNPSQVFANSSVRWTFQAFGGRLRGRLPNGVPMFSTPPGSSSLYNRLGQNGRTTVRMSLPPKGLNRGRSDCHFLSESAGKCRLRAGGACRRRHRSWTWREHELGGF